MYIDPLTLFITGEIFVVYIIINIFLFHKSRLRKVLTALLQEMRYEKLRRQQEKQNLAALERAQNRGPLPDSTGDIFSNDSRPPPKGEIARQLEKHKQAYPHDLTNAIELNQPEQWLRIRLLELEQELLAGNISDNMWQEFASEAIGRMHSQVAAFEQATENQKTNAEGERYTGQLEKDLGESEAKLNEAMIRIRQLEGELAKLTPPEATQDGSSMDAAFTDSYDERLYELKYKNNDLNDTINNLKLELQQANAGDSQDEYIALLEKQISYLEQQIEGLNATTELLEVQLSANNSSPAANSGQEIDTSGMLAPLQAQQAAQAEALGSMKENIEKLKSGEDLDAVIKDQEQQLASLEQIIRESEQCVAILESELAKSLADISRLESDLASSNASNASDKISSLNSTQEGQKDGLGKLKDIIAEIQRGDGNSDELVQQHQEQISRLEGFLAESETLIEQLESEVNSLADQLENANQAGADSMHSDDSTSFPNESVEEMQLLLRQYMSDTESLLKMTSKLEKENGELKSKLSAEII
ncbi:hypothetical protein [Reinekea thalattae]|uniref:Uncharacterized protein n=1 Tax=Reinekea thalattae TaxID=2593301 RepID=A0A5C8Z6H3_9GAMM|nr:hypothetical protein [Reinekea thalattae]TXR53227.1 hypothetical protein FME95_01245 [Reinekea thalattae]